MRGREKVRDLEFRGKEESFFYVKLMLFLKVSVCLGFVWVLVVVGFWGSGVCDMSVISIVSG